MGLIILIKILELGIPKTNLFCTFSILDIFNVANNWGRWWCRWTVIDCFRMPDFLVLVYKIVTWKFGSANFTGKKLHVDIFGRMWNSWRWSCIISCNRWLQSLQTRATGTNISCLLSSSLIWSRKLWSRNQMFLLRCNCKIDCKRIQMSPFMLLIAIMWLEYVIAKNTLIGGATVGIVFVGNELMISIRAALATALRA